MMEKSMIQDLDTMRNSIGFRNTFTTSFHQGGFELKKSKISNLPSYKKSDLSIKLPFVVVFQTMEIQRLSEEIQALRVALKDSERQAFNCQSYQIQIRELTDQCHEYDVSLAEYKDQVQKLQMITEKLYQELQQWKEKYQNFDPLLNQKFTAKLQQCQNLQNQLNKWKDRHRALEKSKDQELEDLKLAMQSQRKSVLDRQIRQLNIKFDSQRNYLQGQIRKMQQILEQRDSQITNIKYEVQALRIQNQTNIEATRKLKQSQNKLNKLTEQLVRLNDLLRRKQQEIDQKDANQDYLKQMIKTLQRQKITHQNQAVKVPQLEGAIKQWAVRFSRLDNENNQNKQHLMRIPGLEKNLQNCTMQLQRLGSLIKIKMQQITDSNLKFDKLKSLYEETKKSQQKVPGLQRKITQMGYQSQRLNDILKKRLVQIQQGKNRIQFLQKALKVFEQAQPQKKRIEQEYKKQIRQIQKYKKQITDLVKQLGKIPQLECLLQNQRNTRQQYAKQVDRLNGVVKDRCQQIQTLNQKIYHLENKVAELSNIENEIQNYKNQNNRMVYEIDNMNGKIKQKCDELQNLAEAVINLQKNLEHYKEVERNLIANIENTQKIIQQLKCTKNQLQNTQHKLVDCQAELNQAKNTIVQINNDREMLNRNLNIKNQQLEHAKSQIAMYLQQIQQLKQIQRCYYALQQQMRLTLNKLKQTQQLLRKQKAKNDQLQHHKQLLINQIQKIHRNGYFPQQFRNMFSSLKNSTKQKQKQIQGLSKKQQIMQKVIDDIQGMIMNVCDTMRVKNNQWVQINDKILIAVGNIKKISTLQDENNELKVQNLQLESQIKMLNLQLIDIEGKKNAGQANLPPFSTSITKPVTLSPPSPSFSMPSSAYSSFVKDTSKRTIDPVIQDQQTSRISSISSNNTNYNMNSNINTKPILSGSSALKIGPIVMNSTSKSKIQQAKLSSKRLSQLQSSTSSSNLNSNLNTNLNSNANSNINFNFNVLGNLQNSHLNPSSTSIPSTRGMSRDITNTYSNTTSFMSPNTKNLISNKQSTQSYFTMRTTKSSSIKQPFTFKSTFRS